MKKLLIALLLLWPELALAKVNPLRLQPAAFMCSLRDSVTTCHDVLGHAFCGTKQSLGVVIDGKKYELLSGDDADAALRTGDYKARMLVGDGSDAAEPVPAYEIDYKNAYEFLFPDGKRQGDFPLSANRNRHPLANGV